MSTSMELAGRASLGRFVQEQRDAIVREWLSLAAPLARSKGLSAPALLDHVPHVLEMIGELTEQLEQGQPIPPLSQLVTGHGFERMREGFEPPEVVADLSALRAAIWTRLASAELAVSARAAQRLDAAIDHVLAGSIEVLGQTHQRVHEALDRIAKSAFEELDLDALLHRLLQLLRETVRAADTASLLLLEGEELRVAAIQGLEVAPGGGVRLRVGEGFAGRVARERRPLTRADVDGERTVVGELAHDERIRALYGVPLLANGRLLGVLQAGSLSRTEFSEQDRALFVGIGERAAMAIGHRWLLHEITRQAEALYRSEARYRVLATASAQTVWTTDVEGRSVEESPSWQAFTGQRWSDHRGYGWLKAIHPEDRARVDQVFAGARATRTLYDTEFRVLRPHGGYTWVHSRGVPVLGPAGEPIEWVGTTSDIDAQKQAEEAERARSRRQQALLALGKHALGDSLEALLEATPRCVADALGVELAVVFELQPDGRTLVPRARTGWSEGAVRPPDAERQPFGGSLAGYALVQRTAVSVEDFSRETRFRPIQLVAEAGAKSALAVVIETAARAGQAYGVLAAYGLAPRRYTDEETLFLRAVANVLAAAIAREREATIRREAETAQRESKAKLQALLDHSPTFIFAKDLEGRYTLVNKRFESFGQPPEWRLGKDDYQLFGTRAAERARAADRLVLETGRVQEFEEPLDLPSGEEKVFLSVKFPIFDAEGRLEGVGGISTDITERKRALERLHESEERMRILVEQIRDYAIILVDPGGRVATWNSGAERLIGYTTSEIIGQHFSRFYPPAEREHGTPEKLLAQARESGRSEDEGWRVRRDGSLYWANVVVTALRDRRGELLGFVEVVRDFTDRRRYEENLRLLADASQVLASSRDLQESLQQVADLLVPSLAGWCSFDLLRPDGTVQDYLAVADSALPGTRQVHEYRRRHPVRITDPRGLAWVLRTGRSLFLPRADETDLEPFVRSQEHVEASRALGLRSLLIVPITWQEQTYGAMVLAAGPDDRRFDATDLAVAEDLGRRAALAVANVRLVEELTRAVRLREDILAVVSHDLKSPLSAIALSTALLQRRGAGLPGFEQQRRQLETIERSTRRMDRLIRDLLDMASIRAGRLALSVRPEPVRRLVEEAVESHAAEALGHEIALVPMLPAEDPWVRGDRERILQVLGNLVGNALKFTSAGDRVTIAVAAGASEVRFSVIDTGPGIRPEDQERIFEPYWSGRENPKRGTGLGLFISKGLVEAQGGRIWLESEPGRGSAFHFTLPREPRPGEEARL